MQNPINQRISKRSRDQTWQHPQRHWLRTLHNKDAIFIQQNLIFEFQGPLELKLLFYSLINVYYNLILVCTNHYYSVTFIRTRVSYYGHYGSVDCMDVILQKLMI